jgi:hypothetical protein
MGGTMVLNVHDPSAPRRNAATGAPRIRTVPDTQAISTKGSGRAVTLTMVPGSNGEGDAGDTTRDSFSGAPGTAT